ncbi:MAG: NifB/NifX family molybdenum-iron cluster-binding protein [Bacteroidales bacterium]
MKAVITSTGNRLESRLDLRFGRCEYFVVYDNGSGTIEFIPNPNKDLEEGAGPASVELVASRNPDLIVSGEFGAKIKNLLDSLKIQLVVLKDPERRIQDIIDLLNH